MYRTTPGKVIQKEKSLTGNIDQAYLEQKSKPSI